MKKMRDFKDVEFAIKNKALILRAPTGKPGAHARPFPLKNFLQLTLSELIQHFMEGTLIYNEDLTGANTLIIKTFESKEEVETFMKNTDMAALADEYRDLYGAKSCFLDMDKLQLLISR